MTRQVCRAFVVYHVDGRTEVTMRRLAEKYTNAHVARAIRCALHERGVAASWAHGVAWALLAGGGVVHAATFTVTSAGDPGAGGMSLRQAVAQANGVPNSVVQ